MSDYIKYNNPDIFLTSLDEHLNKKIEKSEETQHKFTSLKDIYKTEFPKEEWIVEKLIPQGGLTCIGGLPASMKSYFTNYIASCIAQGIPVLDKFPTVKSSILFVDKENRLSQIKHRFHALGVEPSDNIYFLEGNPMLDNPVDLSAICAFIKDHKINLVIIDTLVRSHSQEENNATQMNKVFLALKEITLLKAGVVFIHHFNKRGSGMGSTTDIRELLRGSGDILAMVDSYIALKTIPPFLQLEQGKSRSDELINTILIEPIFTKKTTKFVFTREVEDETRLKRIVVEDEILAILENNSATRKLIHNKLDQYVSPRTIDEALNQLRTRGEVTCYTNGTHEKIYAHVKNNPRADFI